jgi:hypothetical protein
VYDEFERRFRTILTSLGAHVDTALQYFKTAGGEAYDRVLSEYGQHIRDYHIWESPTDSGASDN